MIEFKLIGNWKKYERGLSTFPFLVKQGSITGQRRAAEKLVKIVKKHIDNQDLGWVERSPKTNPGDSRILFDYGDYYNSIKAWRRNNIYFAGVPNDAYNSKGIKISIYAAAHEYGLGTVPARPLWGPSMGELGGSTGVRKIVIQGIYEKLLILRAQGFDLEINL